MTLHATPAQVPGQRREAWAVRIRPHILVACLGAVWGVLGRAILDATLLLLGSNEGSTPMLTHEIGPPATWALIAAATWTPLTGALRPATRQRRVRLGLWANVIGLVLLYVVFMSHHAPRSAGELVLAPLGLPFFAAFALALGGFVAVPLNVLATVWLGQLLDWAAPRPHHGR